MRISAETSTPESRRSRICSPVEALVFGLELLAPLPDEITQRGNRVLGGERLDDQLARELDLVAGLEPDQIRRHPAAVEPLDGTQEQLDALDGLGRQVDRRRLHLHHPPPRDQHRQRRDVVQMDVANEPGGRRHERPGLAAQVKAELHLGHAPVRLHGRARVALDGQAAGAAGCGPAHCPPG